MSAGQPPAPQQGALSLSQIIKAEQAVGVPDAQLARGAAIAEAESAGYTTATGYNRNALGQVTSIDRGLWQINSSHIDVARGLTPQQMYTLQGNASDMFSISRGGTDWSAWTTYTSGAYKQYLPAAEAAVGHKTADPLTCQTPGLGGLWCAIAGAGQAIGTGAASFGQASDQTSGALGGVGNFLATGSFGSGADQATQQAGSQLGQWGQQVGAFLKQGGVAVLLALVIIIVVLRR